MTSRHTREQRWGWAAALGTQARPALGPGAPPDLRLDPQPEAQPPACPVPECGDLPGWLDTALVALSEGSPDACFTVGNEPESVTAARHFASNMLAHWDMLGVREEVALVVTELVTNALRHGLTPIDPGKKCPGPSSIRLRMVHRSQWLLCGIIDGNAQGPQRREPDYVAETGRGLHLVESFTDSWGWRASGDGKVVWALFRPAV